jgi:hypothetical protein
MKLSVTSIIVMLSIGVLLFIGAILVIRHLLELPMYVDREIGSNLNVSSDWIEITPNSPMSKVRQFQSVILNIEGAYTDTDRKEPNLFLADGTQIAPELEILDQDGNWHVLHSGSLGVGTSFDESKMAVSYVGFKSQALEQIISFKSVRLKSTTPFTCKSVKWRNYNLK